MTIFEENCSFPNFSIINVRLASDQPDDINFDEIEFYLLITVDGNKQKFLIK